jgi:gentisate 1,2-dioxygenase
MSPWERNYSEYSDLRSEIQSNRWLISIYRWKDLKNIYRTQWKVNNVPALVRYQRVNGEVSETGRLIEAEILDKAKLQAFLA